MPDDLPILLVDDDASIRKLCARMLSRLKIPVVQCARGDEAVKEINSSQNFRGVLLDLNLPDASGLDLFHQFRGLRPQLGVILFTGSNHPQKEDGLFYLKKPFTPQSLKAALVESGALIDETTG